MAPKLQKYHKFCINATAMLNLIIHQIPYSYFVQWFDILGHTDFAFAEDGIIIVHSQRNFPVAADIILFWWKKMWKISLQFLIRGSQAQKLKCKLSS